MEIIFGIIFIASFYLIGRWLNKDEREAEKVGREKYKREQEELKKRVIIETSTSSEEVIDKNQASFLKRNWGWILAILFLLSPILITLFKYFVLGIRGFGDGPEQCWGGQSCY